MNELRSIFYSDPHPWRTIFGGLLICALLLLFVGLLPLIGSGG